MNYLGINPAKDVQDLYIQNHKMLLRDIRDLNEERYIIFMGWKT